MKKSIAMGILFMGIAPSGCAGAMSRRLAMPLPTNTPVVTVRRINPRYAKIDANGITNYPTFLCAWTNGLTVEQAVEAAGGYRTPPTQRLIVVRSNSVVTLNGQDFESMKQRLEPGDRVDLK